MEEQTYTRDEIFQMLNNPQMLANFYYEYQNNYYEQEANDRYNEYISHQNEGIYGKYYCATNPELINTPKISRDEYELLEFCHNTPMIPFLKEEFKRNPIDRAQAQREYENMMTENYNQYI